MDGNNGNNSRFIGLDLLRFALTMVVLCAHANNFGNAANVFTKTPGEFGKILAAISGAGWVAVDVFFVLSGFLVSGLLFNEAGRTGAVDIRKFLIRRAFKIYPGFWVMLACSIILILWHHGSVLLGALLELFYLQNYGYSICFHTWSLAVEEHFYFLLAAIFLIVRWRTRPNRRLDFNFIPNLFLATAVLCLLLRFVTWWVILSPNNQQMALFIHADHALLDSLFFGVLLSHYWNNCWDDSIKTRIISLRWPLAMAGLCLLAPGLVPVMETQWFNIFGFILIYLGAGCLLLSCLSLDYRPHPRFLKRIAWLGKHSYSVYLWHILAGTCLFPLISPNLDSPFGWFLDTLIYFTLSWSVGILMDRLIESPMLRIRDRLFPSNQAITAPSSRSAPAVLTAFES